MTGRDVLGGVSERGCADVCGAKARACVRDGDCDVTSCVRGCVNVRDRVRDGDDVRDCVRAGDDVRDCIRARGVECASC